MATTQTAPKKKGLINFDFLQKLGKVLMTVIAVMPAAGLMISLGKLVQMGGGDIAAVMTIGTTMATTDYVVGRFKSYYHKGMIPLLHAISKADTNALPKIIKFMKSKKYEFKTLDTIKIKNKVS